MQIIEEAFKQLNEEESTEIKLTKHLDYPDVVKDNLYAVNNNNSYGVQYRYVVFEKRYANKKPYPFYTRYEQSARYEARIWFLKPEDATNFINSQTACYNYSVAKGNTTVEAIRIDVDGDVPCYASIDYVMDQPYDTINPVIANRIDTFTKSGAKSQRNPFVVMTDKERANKEKSQSNLDILINSLKNIPNIQFNDNSVECFDAFIPIQSIINSQEYKERCSSENAELPNICSKIINGIEIIKPTVGGHSIKFQPIINRNYADGFMQAPDNILSSNAVKALQNIETNLDIIAPTKYITCEFIKNELNTLYAHNFTSCGIQYIIHKASPSSISFEDFMIQIGLENTISYELGRHEFFNILGVLNSAKLDLHSKTQVSSNIMKLIIDECFRLVPKNLCDVNKFIINLDNIIKKSISESNSYDYIYIKRGS